MVWVVHCSCVGCLWLPGRQVAQASSGAPGWVSHQDPSGAPWQVGWSFLHHHLLPLFRSFNSMWTVVLSYSTVVLRKSLSRTHVTVPLCLRAH